MNVAYLIIGKNIDLKNYCFEDDSLKVGIDRGSYIALSNNIDLDIAIGDFDSCSKEEINLIESKVKNIVRLNSIKDDTDTEAALNLVSSYDKIIILGGIQGKRIEHFLANIILLSKNPKIVIEDDYSKIFFLDVGKHVVEKENYTFISFISLKESRISLNGFKYELDNYLLRNDSSLCFSNEFKSSKGEIEVSLSPLIVILSKKD